jgi:hypothetical protein
MFSFGLKPAPSEAEGCGEDWSIQVDFGIGRRATIAEIQAADTGMEVDVGFQRVVDRLGQLLTPDVRRAERPLSGYRRFFREESTMP